MTNAVNTACMHMISNLLTFTNSNLNFKGLQALIITRRTPALNRILQLDTDSRSAVIDAVKLTSLFKRLTLL